MCMRCGLCGGSGVRRNFGFCRGFGVCRVRGVSGVDDATAFLITTATADSFSAFGGPVSCVFLFLFAAREALLRALAKCEDDLLTRGQQRCSIEKGILELHDNWVNRSEWRGQ